MQADSANVAAATNAAAAAAFQREICITRYPPAERSYARVAAA
jgi:hypothetical protein